MSKGWGKGSTTRWRTFRAWVLARDGYLCRVGGTGCTGAAPLVGGHVDHIVPLHMGGDKWDPLNVRASCEHCNLTRKRASLRDEPAPKRVSNW